MVAMLNLGNRSPVDTCNSMHHDESLTQVHSGTIQIESNEIELVDKFMIDYWLIYI